MYLFTDVPRPLRPKDMVRAGIGKNWWEASLARVPDGFEYKDRTAKYVENLKENLKTGMGLLFFGPYGSGKTGLGVIVLKAAIAHGVPAYMLAASELQDVILKDKQFDEYESCLERAQNVPLFLLDDLGAEHVGKQEFVVAAIEALIRHRLANKRTTLMTTNVDIAVLTERYGAALVDVLKEVAALVRVSGVNWRDAIAQANSRTLQQGESV